MPAYPGLLPEDLSWLHYPNHYKVLGVPKDASDSTIAEASDRKASRWQKEGVLKLGAEFSRTAVNTLRQSRDVLLIPKERERFDRGERSVKCFEGCRCCT